MSTAIQSRNERVRQLDVSRIQREIVPQLDVNKTCIVVSGNLYFNSALTRDISWNQPKTNKLYRQKTHLPLENISDSENKSN